MSRAGKSIRAMALRRRIKAIQQFVGAAILVGLPLGLPVFLKPMVAIARTTATVPIWVYPFCWGLAGLLVSNGLHLWKRANHADQGAQGEEAIAQLLEPLKREGWQIEYNVRDRAVGDVDVFLVSPKGKAFTIDVKSHRGYVYSQQQQLYRKLGATGQPFEKDFLAQAKKQAIAMQQRQKCQFVTPLIVFANANVGIRPNPVQGVYVVKGQDLLACLRSLE